MTNEMFLSAWQENSSRNSKVSILCCIFINVASWFFLGCQTHNRPFGIWEYTNTHVCYFDRVRNRRELHASLKGATLGDAEEEVDDTLKWIKRNKKKEKELAKKRQLELENRDKELLDEYTERKLTPNIFFASTKITYL